MGEIWCLHRVLEKRSRYKSNRDLEITPEYFEQLINHKIQEGYCFITIDHLLKSMPLLRKRKYINISFDDGFHDVYENAFPILHKYSIPFTLYLTTGFPDNTADTWWISLERLGYDKEEFESVIKKIYEGNGSFAEIMHEITGDYEINTEKHSIQWEEVKEMVKSGLCTVGSHTVSHSALTYLSPERCLYELYQSKRKIEQQLGIVVQHFSYPHSLQNSAVQQAVKNVGYKSAALGYGGRIRKGFNPYALNRVFIIQP